MQIKQNEIYFGGAVKFHYFPATTSENDFFNGILDVIHAVNDEQIYCIGKLKTLNNMYASFNSIKHGEYNTEEAFLICVDNTSIASARKNVNTAIGWDVWFLAMKN